MCVTDENSFDAFERPVRNPHALSSCEIRFGPRSCFHHSADTVDLRVRDSARTICTKDVVHAWRAYNRQLLIAVKPTKQITRKYRNQDNFHAVAISPPLLLHRTVWRIPTKPQRFHDVDLAATSHFHCVPGHGPLAAGGPSCCRGSDCMVTVVG